MIRVNLLPMNQRPVRHSALPYLLGIAVLAAGVVLMGFLWVTKQAEAMQLAAEQSRHQEQLDGLQDFVDESNELQARKNELADKVFTIKEITQDRIIWSRQLWNLSRLAPDNFWYNHVGIDKKRFTETRQVYNKDKKVNETQTVTVEKPILVLKGYVAGDEEGLKDVNQILFATENDPEFSSLFRLEPPMFFDTEFDGYAVKGFTLQYVIELESGGPQS
jgi:hypothetical protein